MDTLSTLLVPPSSFISGVNFGYCRLGGIEPQKVKKCLKLGCNSNFILKAGGIIFKMKVKSCDEFLRVQYILPFKLTEIKANLY